MRLFSLTCVSSQQPLRAATIATRARRKPSQVAVQNVTPKVDEKSARFKVVIKPSKIHRWGLYAFLGPVSEDDLWELLEASEQEFQPAILQ